MNVEIKFDAVIKNEAIEEISSMVTNDYLYGLIDEESASQMGIEINEIYDTSFSIKPDAEQSYPHDTSVKDCAISFKANVDGDKEIIDELKRTVDHHLDYLIDNVHEHTDIIELHNAHLTELEPVKERNSSVKYGQFDKMVNFFKDIMDCSEQDVQELFDSHNGIDVADMFRTIVENTGMLPNRNDIYVEAVREFCYENDLEYGKDVEIYANSWADTNIYVDERVPKHLISELCDKMNMEFEVDVNIKVDMTKPHSAVVDRD